MSSRAKRQRLVSPNNSMDCEQHELILPPVIVHFTDSKGNFKQTHTTHMFKTFTVDLISQIGGQPRRSEIAKGGDLFVHPSTEEQQQKLLELTTCGGRPIKCSLPKSCTVNKGVIEGVPHPISNSDLEMMLRGQHVIEAYRFRHKSGAETERVVLSFSSTAPKEVVVAGITFRVGPYWPTPYKCSKCHRLGHTSGSGVCNELEHCSICCKVHPDDQECTTWCVNCQKDDHQADSRDCPAFIRMRNALREKTRIGGSLKEAFASLDAKQKRNYSYAAAAASGTALASGANAEPLDLARRLRTLEEEVAALKTITVPAISMVADSAQKIATEAKAEAAGVKREMNSRLDGFFNKQQENWKKFLDEQKASLQALMGGPGVSVVSSPEEVEEENRMDTTETGRTSQQHHTPPAAISTVPSHILPPRRAASGATAARGGGRGGGPANKNGSS